MNRLLYVIVLACIVAYASYRTVDWRTVLDRALLASAFALLLFFVMGAEGAEVAEQFTTGESESEGGGGGGESAISEVIPEYVHKENLADIRGIDGLSFYATAFHPDSTNGLGSKKWKSVAVEGDDKGFELSTDNVVDDTYVSLKEGNHMTGPLSNELGITDPRSFVVMVVAKIPTDGFVDWIGDESSDEIQNLFQLFTHIAPNNLLSIGFSKNQESVAADNGNAKVFMYLSYSDKTTVSEIIDVELGKPYVYAAVVSTTDISLKRAKVGAENFETVVTLEESTTTTATAIAVPNIASRPIEFNGSGANKIDVDVYNFAFFSQVPSATNLLKALTHFHSNFNPAETGCPYDDPTCYSDECIGIDNWADPMALVDKPDCRKKVDAHCTQSFSSEVCRCWDGDHNDYNSPKCKLWRAFMKNDPSHAFDAESLSAAQIADVKQRNNFVTVAEKDAAVEAAKKEGDRAKTEAVASENKRLIDFYKNAPAPRSSSKASDHDDDHGGESGSGVADFWGDPGKRKSRAKTRVRKGGDDDDDDDAPIVNPYDGTRATPEGESAGRIKKISRLRGLDEDEDDGTTRTGLFGWFRGLFSG